MRCSVYKSLRQYDYYLYVRATDALACLPDGLKRLLGCVEKIMELDLHAGRPLAQVDVLDVMRQIDAQGYYLQMPPRSGTTPLVS